MKTIKMDLWRFGKELFIYTISGALIFDTKIIFVSFFSYQMF